MIVAIALGRAGIDVLLVASQVVLSIVLPFITFPLLYCTASKSIMSVHKMASSSSSLSPDSIESGTRTAVDLLSSPEIGVSLPLPLPPTTTTMTPGGLESADADVQGELVDYSNNKLTIAVGVLIWLVVVAANMYVIVELGLGKGV